MRCITRYDMDFDGLVIPDRTEATVISTLQTDTVNAPGVQLTLMIHNHRIGRQNTSNKNVVRPHYDNLNRAETVGIVVHTSTQAVYMDAKEPLYAHKKLYGWQVDKIFKDGIPNTLQMASERHSDVLNLSDKYHLQDVIAYLDNELAAWVENNATFRKVTKREYENGDAHPDAEPGTRVLTDTSYEQLMGEVLRVQRLLEESTGFTYQFTAGLNWLDH